MAYNHGREERKWRLWKEAEEKILRKYGVDEGTIEEIRIYDRAEFNSNRQFYRYMNWSSQEKRTPKSEVLGGERTLSEACTFDQRWEIILVGCVAPAAVVVGLDPAEDKVTHQLPWHTGAVELVNQLFLQRCEKKLSMRALSKQQWVRPILCRMEPSSAITVLYS